VVSCWLGVSERAEIRSLSPHFQCGLAARTKKPHFQCGLFQVTAQTGELASVTDRAGLQIQSRFFVGMGVQKTVHVAGRFQLSVFGMAERAAIGQIDLIVADQAIRHARHIVAADGVRLIEPSMARRAEICGVQQRADFRAVLAEIGSLVDSRRDYGRDVAELEVLGVAEFFERGLRRQRARYG